MSGFNAKLEQYRIYATELYSFENRAQITSRLYVTLNTAAVSLILISFDKCKDISATPTLMIALSTLAIFFCIIWRLTLRSITRHTTAKHIVIQNMEKDLPFQPYTEEWYEQLDEGNGYIRTTVLHEFFPWVFILAYVAVIIYALILY